MSALAGKIEDENKARLQEADKKIAPLKAKKDELSAELDKTKKKISAIEAEFTKDPEE